MQNVNDINISILAVVIMNFIALFGLILFYIHNEISKAENVSNPNASIRATNAEDGREEHYISKQANLCIAMAKESLGEEISCFIESFNQDENDRMWSLIKLRMNTHTENLYSVTSHDIRTIAFHKQE